MGSTSASRSLNWKWHSESASQSTRSTLRATLGRRLRHVDDFRVMFHSQELRFEGSLSAYSSCTPLSRRRSHNASITTTTSTSTTSTTSTESVPPRLVAHVRRPFETLQRPLRQLQRATIHPSHLNTILRPKDTSTPPQCKFTKVTQHYHPTKTRPQVWVAACRCRW